MVFKGTDWCSDFCRKALLGKIKCYYETVSTYTYDDIEVCAVHRVEVCAVHHVESKYGPEKGPDRPCLAIEPY
jgi:hypothetical protein